MSGATRWHWTPGDRVIVKDSESPVRGEHGTVEADHYGRVVVRLDNGFTHWFSFHSLRKERSDRGKRRDPLPLR